MIDYCVREICLSSHIFHENEFLLQSHEGCISRLDSRSRGSLGGGGGGHSEDCRVDDDRDSGTDSSIEGDKILGEVAIKRKR